MYGVGQGLNEGVQMAAGFLTDAMKMKQRQKQFDQSQGQQQKQFDETMQQHKSEMGQRDKLFYDRLAIEYGWNKGRYGNDDEQSLPPDAFPKLPAAQAQAAPPAVPSPLPSMGPAPRAQPQVTIRPSPMTMAQALLPASRFVAKPTQEFMPSTMSARYPRWRR